MTDNPAGEDAVRPADAPPGADDAPGTVTGPDSPEPGPDDTRPGADPDPAAVEQDLNALVEEAHSKANEYLDLAQRTRADFDNYRKRMAAENAAAASRGRLEVIGPVIEAIDNLERVLDAAGIDRTEALEGEIPAEAPVAEQGVIVAWRDMHAVLRRAGVEAYSPEGEVFDPAWHEALQAIPAEGIEPGTVVEVMQRGYRSGETVLRAARVMVAQ